MEEKHFIIACIDKSSSARLNIFTQIYCEYSELWTRAALNITKRRVEFCCACVVGPAQFWMKITNIPLFQFYILHIKIPTLYMSHCQMLESRVWFASKNLTPCRMH